MAGLLDPFTAYELTGRLKSEVGLPVHLHTHSTTGFSVATYLKAAEAGVDIVDCAISTLSMGTSQPAVETLVAIFKDTDRDTGINIDPLKIIASHFDKVRKENYQAYEANFQGVDARTLYAQVPGGMLSNMTNQLKELNALDKYDAVMEEIPRVREDFGFPPLVTPSSQIVGVQAVMNVIAGERYKVVPEESKLYLKGMYGRPPAAINQEVRKKALGNEPAIDVRPADLLNPELPKIEAEKIPYLKSLEDKVTYAMFGKKALEFLEAREKGELYKYKEKLIAKPKKTDDTKKASDENIYKYNVQIEGQTFEVLISEGEIGQAVKSVKPKIPATATSGSSDLEIKSELPGQVVEVNVKPGEKVKKGDKLLVVEAMKMMNDILSPADATVNEVLVSTGEKIEIGITMVKLKKD
jgi:pyruvate/oxaloacetate carboxyltransferase